MRTFVVATTVWLIVLAAIVTGIATTSIVASAVGLCGVIPSSVFFGYALRGLGKLTFVSEEPVYRETMPEVRQRQSRLKARQ